MKKIKLKMNNKTLKFILKLIIIILIIVNLIIFSIFLIQKGKNEINNMINDKSDGLINSLEEKQDSLDKLEKRMTVLENQNNELKQKDEELVQKNEELKKGIQQLRISKATTSRSSSAPRASTPKSSTSSTPNASAPSSSNNSSNSGWITATVTAYCGCSSCCGKSTGITASGTKATAGRTIAASSQYSFGTKIEIQGYGTYVVEDRGGAIQGNRIDMFFSSHSEALAFGRKTLLIKVVS